MGQWYTPVRSPFPQDLCRCIPLPQYTEETISVVCTTYAERKTMALEISNAVDYTYCTT